ncbi:hypothetical protein OAC89_03840 [Deltaproteobacteria bacterium]|nr:hypothetical protein [Deltaproteobacteria bacterium]
METSKIIIKTAFVLTGLSVLVLLVLSIVQYQQIQKLTEGATSEKVVESESTGVEMPGSGETVQKSDTQRTTVKGMEKEIYKDDIDELTYQLDAAEEELDMAHEQLSDELSRRSEFSKNSIELQKKLLEDPTTKKMLRNTFKGMLDINYGPLYKELALSQEKLEEFKELLINQQVSFMDINQEMLGVSLSGEKKREIEQRLEDLKKENETKISECLGGENYETYESYQERLSERTLVTNFMESLNSDDKLTADQEQDLIDSMYEDRKDLHEELDHDPDKITFPDEMNEEEVARSIIRMTGTHERYMESANSILSESQMDQFEKYLNQRLEMQGMSLRISIQMYGSPDTEKSADEQSE